ncbi:MAG TPA: ABC transporter transmembrane domain-containing protein, partial [Chitinophagales bacterium]|nr:ABC transporter transmembrane domain-containing protein [Chitinophagales bacterium]
VVAFMFYTDWKLTLICLITFPIIIWATYIFKEKVRVSFNDVRDKVAQLNAFVQEHISGMRIVQIFNAQDKEFENLTTSIMQPMINLFCIIRFSFLWLK